MRVRLIDLDGSLPAQPVLADLARAGLADVVEARDLAPRLRLVASRAALAALLRRLPSAGAPEPAVNFLGSGDFHHLAYALLSRVRERFTILHFDNHPDWVRFPATLNCGSWVNRALELAEVARVVTIGPCSADLSHPEWKTANLQAIRDGRLEVYAWVAPATALWGRPVHGPGACTVAGRLAWRNLAQESFPAFLDELCGRLPDLPVWISLDKDVLGPAEAATNWDQGAMRLDHVLEAVTRVAACRRILGLDVCGDYSPPRFRDPFRAFLSITDRPRPAATALRATAINDNTNRRLLDGLRRALSASGWSS